jgi:hypothetical protein
MKIKKTINFWTEFRKIIYDYQQSIKHCSSIFGSYLFYHELKKKKKKKISDYLR